MKRSRKHIGFIICMAILFAVSVIFIEKTYSTGGTTAPAPGTPAVTITKPPTKPPCCIAGKYEGIHKDTPSATCPKPGEGKFIMEINQDQGCGSKIWGKVIDPKDGTTQDFEGVVTYDPEKKCCKIQGRIRRPPAAAGAPAETTTFSGLLCKKDGKWAGKGIYTTTRPGATCNGTWEMKQV